MMNSRILSNVRKYCISLWTQHVIKHRHYQISTFVHYSVTFNRFLIFLYKSFVYFKLRFTHPNT